MPFGEFQHAIDEKGRVVIPVPFREFVEDGMVVTRGMEGCLYAFPLRNWNLIEESLTSLPLTDPASRGFIRFFYSGAAKLRMDGQGRVLLPQNLREFARLDGECVVAGAPNRIELWETERWRAALAEIQNTPPQPDLLRSLIG